MHHVATRLATFAALWKFLFSENPSLGKYWIKWPIE